MGHIAATVNDERNALIQLAWQQERQPDCKNSCINSTQRLTWGNLLELGLTQMSKKQKPSVFVLKQERQKILLMTVCKAEQMQSVTTLRNCKTHLN